MSKGKTYIICAARIGHKAFCKAYPPDSKKVQARLAVFRDTAEEGVRNYRGLCLLECPEHDYVLIGHVYAKSGPRAEEDFLEPVPVDILDGHRSLVKDHIDEQFKELKFKLEDIKTYVVAYEHPVKK